MSAQLQPKPVLYVEDDENDVFLMTRGFQKAGIERSIRVVGNGREAISYLAGEGVYADRQAHPLPCMVLLDLNLPLLAGMEVLAWMRAQGPLRELPVVIFSSSEHPGDRQRASQLGATDYWSKPGNPARFVEFAQDIKQRWVLEAP